MRSLVTLVGAILLASWAFAGSANAASSEDVLAHFLPADVLASMNSIDASTRAALCQGGIGDRFEAIAIPTRDALAGLDSQMYDKGYLTDDLNYFSSYLSEIATAAVVSNSDDQKTLYIKLLSKWARAGAYTKTVNCQNIDCPEWTSQRGHELSAAKDFDSVEERIVPMSWVYYSFFKDFKPDELADDHKAIEDWLAIFRSRVRHTGDLPKPTIAYGFGLNWQLWAMPVSDLLRGHPQDVATRLQMVNTALDTLIHDDGSLDKRTTRGARALWYHYAGLGETFFALEMLRANGIDAYPRLQTKLDKAVKIFLDGNDDMAHPEKLS